MNLQISPIGIGIIGAYSLVVLVIIAWPLSRLLRNWHWKWLLIVPLVLPLLAAPWAEEAWIAWHFNQACQAAGVHVYRQIAVEGYFNQTSSEADEFSLRMMTSMDLKTHGFVDWSQPRLITAKNWLKGLGDDGFLFYEVPFKNDMVRRIEKVKGHWQVTLLDHPTARYYYKYAYQPTPYVIEEPTGWKVQKIERQVVDSATGELLGRDSLFKRFPSIAEALWMRFLGNGITICPGPNVKPYVPPPPFPQAVIHPISKP